MPQKTRNAAVLAMKKPFSYGWEKGMSGGYEIRNIEHVEIDDVDIAPFCR
ncbi:hypothetical protein QAA45_07160 [Bifidobacterium breve]|nr:hypothetical protein [Bifidobacterium breve]MDO8169632.1 hypothetical protein [Bifidobacterium breve]